mmetsp:Transcript_37318/g.71536  ORF Transcript_37318/g.71536 Transcript_37318/m.71536 type:complete len:192 (+) Transcript_37318:282-857(+)|eukprot:CAMPEP_0114230364 /NCGR_PEP_ID=MMETSP0058-20121206/3429_1 /TAXON_ID=36894 /ORGANISM="Pyramimonas parkeae, CCMP726" /LENGTH=191 /DNA_ID=CAMNT_0001341557 /DNA_START=185 /DNA_END=760 /DNA_ORIENTATION=+
MPGPGVEPGTGRIAPWCMQSEAWKERVQMEKRADKKFYSTERLTGRLEPMDLRAMAESLSPPKMAIARRTRKNTSNIIFESGSHGDPNPTAEDSCTSKASRARNDLKARMSNLVREIDEERRCRATITRELNHQRAISTGSSLIPSEFNSQKIRLNRQLSHHSLLDRQKHKTPHHPVPIARRMGEFEFHKG